MKSVRARKILSLILFCSFMVNYFNKAMADTPAQHELERGYLFDTIELEFEPVTAWILLRQDDGDHRRVAAKIVALSSRSDTAKTSWLIGTRVPPDVKGSPSSFYLIALGSHGEVDGKYSSSREVNESEASMGITLNERMRVLDNWHKQLEQQEGNLRRLRSDVDVIADIGRIVEVREESKQILKRIEDIGRDLEDLAKTVGNMKNKPAPNNFLRREAELTQQVSELASTAKRAESAAQNAGKNGKPKSDKQLIESTKGVDPADLEKKLKELDRQRQKLEAA